jgi:hypothetical protein
MSKGPKFLIGVVTGLAAGVALDVVLGCAVIFAALSNSRTTEIAGVIRCAYQDSADGGFSLGLSSGPGIVRVVIAAALLGGVSSAFLKMPSRRTATKTS